MGNITAEYLDSLDKAVAEAKEYLGSSRTVVEFSYSPTEVASKVSGYASSLSTAL